MCREGKASEPVCGSASCLILWDRIEARREEEILEHTETLWEIGTVGDITEAPFRLKRGVARVNSVDFNLSSVRMEETGDELESCAFSRAINPKKTDDLSPGDLKI